MCKSNSEKPDDTPISNSLLGLLKDTGIKSADDIKDDKIFGADFHSRAAEVADENHFLDNNAFARRSGRSTC